MNNLNLIIGDNLDNHQFYLQAILKKINADEENIIKYNLSEFTLKDILDEASMPSLFSDIKVIIGSNFDISKLNDIELDYLTKYLKSINKIVYIILLASKVDARLKAYKLIKDNFNIIETTKTNNTDNLVKYVSDKVKTNNYKMSDSDITYFLDKVGNNINNINSELDKLLIYKSDSKTINTKDINLLVTDNIDNVIYEFTNAFLEDNTNELVKMYNNFKLENVSFDYLIASLSNTLRQALIIKLLSNEKKSNLEISKVIGKKEFYVKKMLERLYRYNIDDLAKYITKLAKIDANFKSGKANIDELELFIIDKDR